MSEKYENVELVKEEADTLKEMEKIFGIPLPHLEKVSWEDFRIDKKTHQIETFTQHEFGFIAQNQHVVGLGLSFDSINVKSLKTPQNMPKFSKFKMLKTLDVQNWERVFAKYFKEEKKKNENFQLAYTTGTARMSFNERKKERDKAFSTMSQAIIHISPTTLYNQLKNLKELQILNTSNSSLINIKPLSGLLNLRSLDLSDNNLKSIPSEISALKQLESINLEGNSIENYPDVLSELTSLKKLDLSHTNIKNLPESFGNLTSLEELILPAWITEFPESFVNLKELKKLVASNLPKSLGEFKKLEMFILRDGKMEVLSDSIMELKSLKTLEIDNCRNLKSISNSLGNLVLLKTLKITGNNSLEKLPESLFNLNSLQSLNLYNNNIESLPDEFGSFPLLERLNLSNNELKNISYSIYKLNNLIDFSIENNPLELNDKIISAKTLPEIKEYSKKKMAINVFVSHAVVDFEPCHIEQLCLYLENQLEIDIAFFCERDLVSNIDSFMDKNVPNSQIVLFIGTPTSINSKDCGYELKLSREYDVEIIPIKSTEIEWLDLANIGLSRELGIEIDFADTENFEHVCKNIYDYIKQMKRQIDVFDKEKGKIDKLTIGLKMLERNYEKMTKEIEDLEGRIKRIEEK